MHYEFSTKAGTLNLLQGKLSSATIAPLVFFTVADWQVKRVECLTRVKTMLGNNLGIVRSSCQREDGANQSNAGAFLSLPNITIDNSETAIEQVIASYGEACKEDEVLVQPMLQQVVRSGVAFSHDPNTCAPYRVINWSKGRDTTTVTTGMGGHTFYQAAKSALPPPAKLIGIIALLEELLNLFGHIPLDCEFAVSHEQAVDVLWLLQVRPLVLLGEPESKEKQAEKLQCIRDKVARGMSPHPFLMGQRTAYGVMPDWNPAEIIGVRPKPLALSIYRELITDSIWAYQRHNYGYRNLRSFPLMPHFLGLPYIDLRLSFNSFIPADLEEGLAARLVDYYMDCLLAEPTLHDKVEFEIVFSCYTLDLQERLRCLLKAGFSEDECFTIAKSLRRLTNRILHPTEGLWRSDAAKLDTLNTRREQLLASNADLLEKIYWLLEDTKRYGTLPFAGLARAGFVAIQILKSLVSTGVFSQADYDAFIGSISTVSGQLARDSGTLDRETFLSRYGHLRPGTYDVLSPRYDEEPELYFDWNQRLKEPDPSKPFSLTLPKMRELVKLLASHDLQIDSISLFDFLQAGIELRESAKFHFTHNLSDALTLIVEYAAQWGFNRDDLSYCNISVFKELHIAAVNPKTMIKNSIEEGKAQYQDTLSIKLPPLIVKPDDIWSFELPEANPNFITQKLVTAPVVSHDQRHLFSGSIICIQNADPGFDWLFSYPIAGLITAWGGVNSHMAIRAGEIGLPAVIGSGEILYRQWSSAKRLHIDCAGQRVKILA